MDVFTVSLRHLRRADFTIVSPRIDAWISSLGKFLPWIPPHDLFIPQRHPGSTRLAVAPGCTMRERHQSPTAEPASTGQTSNGSGDAHTEPEIGHSTGQLQRAVTAAPAATRSPDIFMPTSPRTKRRTSHSLCPQPPCGRQALYCPLLHNIGN